MRRLLVRTGDRIGDALTPADGPTGVRILATQREYRFSTSITQIVVCDYMLL